MVEALEKTPEITISILRWFFRNLSPDSIAFLYKWQTLLGSFIGPFLAILVTAAGFTIRRAIDKHDASIEGLRRIEVLLADSVNITYINQEKIRDFVERLEQIISSVQATPPDGYSFESTNYPQIDIVEWDKEVSQANIHSNYLHNKLLGLGMGIGSQNSLLNEMREDYRRLGQLNEFLVSKNVTPANQQDAYVGNLKNFQGAMRQVIKVLGDTITVAVEAKTYTRLLRRKWIPFIFTVWFYEGRSFKFFLNYSEFRKYSQHPYHLKRVDARIRKLADDYLTEAKRLSQEK